MGSKLFTKDIVAQKNYAVLEEKVRAIVAIAQSQH